MGCGGGIRDGGGKGRGELIGRTERERVGERKEEWKKRRSGSGDEKKRKKWSERRRREDGDGGKIWLKGVEREKIVSVCVSECVCEKKMRALKKLFFCSVCARTKKIH